jgi:hypothetical protein
VKPILFTRTLCILNTEIISICVEKENVRINHKAGYSLIHPNLEEESVQELFIRLCSLWRTSFNSVDFRRFFLWKKR